MHANVIPTLEIHQVNKQNERSQLLSRLENMKTVVQKFKDRLRECFKKAHQT